MPTKPQTLVELLKRKKEKDAKNSENVAIQEPPQPSSRKSNKLSLDDIMLEITKHAQLHLKHFLFPDFGVTETPLESLRELQDFPNCTISVPQPIYVEPKHCERVDICHRRPLTRTNYKKRLHFSATRYETHLKRNRNYRALEKQSIFPNSVFDLAERLERNPDPYFNCSYDYYFTGGNLLVLPEQSYVVHASGDNLMELSISQFPDGSNELQKLHSKTLTANSEIFELSLFHSSKDDYANCFLSRQRNTIFLYTVKEDGQLKQIKQFNNRTTPFISVAQSNSDFNKLILTTMKQHVRVYDLNSSTPTLVKLFQAGGESDSHKLWNVVKPWDENTFLYANTRELLLMDLRTSPTEWRKNACGFGDSDFFCGNIVSLALSEFDNQFYVGTTHKLYGLDPRCWGHRFGEAGTVCRWSHQMEYPPIMLETFRNQDSEFIALASPVPDDLHICELMRCGKIKTSPKKKAKLDDSTKSQKYSYKTLTLPYQPTTLREAYDGARLRGKCLRPESDLPNRINCCRTGMAFYSASDGASDKSLLLTSTSNGDVFARDIGERESQAHEPRTSAFTDEVMVKFEEKICELTQPPLNFTEVVEMNAMSKVFRCTNLSRIKQDIDEDVDGSGNDEKEEKPTIKKRRSLGRWQKSIQTLHSYKDVLVQDILSVWDIDFDKNETDIKLSDLKKTLNIKPDPKALVDDWLESSSRVPPMTSVPLDNLPSSSADPAPASVADLNASTKDTVDESFQLDFSLNANEFPQSTQLFDDSARDQLDISAQTEQNQTLPNVSFASSSSKVKPATVKKKKKTKYVKGF